MLLKQVFLEQNGASLKEQAFSSLKTILFYILSRKLVDSSMIYKQGYICDR